MISAVPVPVSGPNANPKIAIATTYGGSSISSAPHVALGDLFQDPSATLNFGAYGAPMVAAYYSRPHYSSFAAKLN